MAKTLVVAVHAAGSHQNGYDNCHARIAYGGHCPGHELARWLNELGDDDDYYIKPTKYNNGGTTNLRVRTNYINYYTHIKPVDARRAQLRAEIQRSAASLRHARRELRALEAGGAK